MFEKLKVWVFMAHKDRHHDIVQVDELLHGLNLYLPCLMAITRRTLFWLEVGTIVAKNPREKSSERNVVLRQPQSIK